MRNILLAVALIATLAVILMSTGCANNVAKYRDPDFTVGCKVIEAQVKLGYFNQEGGAEVCKVKCSENLPEKFTYKYDNSRTGCHVSVGEVK